MEYIKNIYDRVYTRKLNIFSRIFSKSRCECDRKIDSRLFKEIPNTSNYFYACKSCSSVYMFKPEDIKDIDEKRQSVKLEKVNLNILINEFRQRNFEFLLHLQDTDINKLMAILQYPKVEAKNIETYQRQRNVMRKPGQIDPLYDLKVTEVLDLWTARFADYMYNHPDDPDVYK